MKIDCSHGRSIQTSRCGGGNSSIGNVFREDIERRVTPNAAVNIGLNLLATNSPPIGALLTAYDIALRADEIAELSRKFYEEYQTSGSLTKAAKVAAPDVTDIILDEVKRRLIDTAIPGTDLNSQVINNVIKAFI